MATSARRAAFFLREFLAPHDARADYRALRAAESLDGAQLAALTEARALWMARTAYGSSPFYRRRYREAGIAGPDLDDPAVFARLPILEKADVRAHFADIRTPEATRATADRFATGGSTGEPTRVLHDRRAGQHLLARRLHAWWGVDPADARGVVWRMGARTRGLPGRLREFGDWPVVTVRLNSGRLDAAAVDRFLDRWQQVRPALLMGYVGAVLELAALVERSGRPMAAPITVGVTSAPVTAAQKRWLREVLGAPVHDHYQCVEVPAIAGECRHGDGLHVFTDARFVEILGPDDRPVASGEVGDVVVTDLRNRVFPLVRYRLGDRASWRGAACRCGMPFPLLNPVRGRVTDVLRMPSGLAVAGEGLTAIFDPWPDAVRQFQVRQHADASLALRCVPGPAADAHSLMERAAADLRTLVRGEVPVGLEVVDSIPHDRGKTRFIVREADA